jgi:hypothetical protein
VGVTGVGLLGAGWLMVKLDDVFHNRNKNKRIKSSSGIKKGQSATSTTRNEG